MTNEITLHVAHYYINGPTGKIFLDHGRLMNGLPKISDIIKPFDRDLKVVSVHKSIDGYWELGNTKWELYEITCEEI